VSEEVAYIFIPVSLQDLISNNQWSDHRALSSVTLIVSLPPCTATISSPYQIRFQELIGSSLIGTACSKAFWSTSAGALAQAIINVDNWTAMKVLQVPIYI
jgi:hypothetical protein